MSLAQPVVSRRWRKGCLRAPAAQCQGVLLCLQRLLNLPTERQAKLLVSFQSMRCNATACSTPRSRGETLRLGRAKMHKAKLDGSTGCELRVERSKGALGGVLTV